MRLFSILTLCYLMCCVYSKQATNKALTESLGQEVIEIGHPIKELPQELEEEPSAEVDDEDDLTTIHPPIATRPDLKKPGGLEPKRKTKDIERIDMKDEEEARIEKELADIYKDTTADYKDGDIPNKLSGQTPTKPIARAGNFKFQPDPNDNIERWRTSVDDIVCDSRNNKKLTTPKGDDTMELDCLLTREGEEPWGFRLVGGTEFGVPLTVVKVQPNSPAAKAGLQISDLLVTIAGVSCLAMNHDDSKAVLADAADFLDVKVVRGLYDPVLDETEPIYEETDQDYLDQPSDPTEVFTPIEFTDQPQGNLPDILDSARPQIILLAHPSGGLTPVTPVNTMTLSESRSLTASPFVLPTKPYRPFSTEPLSEIPILEDPVILNPDYQDVWPDLLVDEDFLPKTKFKLPVSEHYDPDGKGIKAKLGENAVKEDLAVCQKISVDTKSVETKHVDTVFASALVSETNMKSMESNVNNVSNALVTEMKDVVMSNDEVKFMQKMKQEIDLDRIESTANTVVEDSIDKAVTVAQEIKKEIDIELKDISQSTEVKSITKVSQSDVNQVDTKNEVTNKEPATNEVEKLADLIDQTTEIIKQNGAKTEKISINKQIEKLEASVIEDQKAVEERKQSMKQEIQDVIEVGAVKNKSSAFEKEVESKEVQQRNSVEATDFKNENKEYVTKLETKDKKHVSARQEDSKVSSERKISTSRLLAEQRAYTIGLNTIPNIRGSVHSSYHYNLLLKTFFIHLTDVMVALSRFILAEPILNNDEDSKSVNTQETVLQSSVNENVRKDVADYQHVSKIVKQEIQQRDIQNKGVASEDSIKKSKVLVSNKNQTENKEVEKKQDRIVAAKDEVKNVEENHVSNTNFEYNEEKRKTTGSQMSQLTEKKSENLMQSMGAVINEFQSKAGIEECERTSENNKIETKLSGSEMSQLSENKSENLIQSMGAVITEFQSKAGIEESEVISEAKKEKTVLETTEVKTKSKTPKQMYVAVVESHVYTNKDTVLEEQLSQASSLQSPIETKEIETSQLKQEIAKAVIEAAEEKISEKVEAVQVSQNFQQIENRKEQTVEISDKTEQKQNQVFQETSSSEISSIGVTDNIVVAVQEKQQINAFVAASNEEKYTTENVSVKDESLVINKTSEIKQGIIVQENKHSAVVMKEQIKDVSDVSKISQESTTQQNIVEKPIERPTTLNLDEDPHIVKKKKFQMQVSESKVVEEVIKNDVQHKQSIDSKMETSAVAIVNAHEDPHIVKKKAETATSENTSIKEESSITREIKEQTRAITQTEIESTNKQTAFLNKHEQINVEAKYEHNETKVAENSSLIQESTFIAKSINAAKPDLIINTDMAKPQRTESQTSVDSTDINTPTPSTVPPTPFTDEYIFKLQIELPKGITPVPPDTPSPVDEDPHIVKKNLIPHIDTTIDSPIIYDPPLPTPPGSKVTSPVYTKPGLRGGADKPEYSKEEILEIERKSSLLASAIDETIKSIEEYKEEVGINNETVEMSEERLNVICNGESVVEVDEIFINKTNNHAVAFRNNVEIEEVTNGVYETNGNNNGETNGFKTDYKTIDEVTEATFEYEGEETNKRDAMDGYRPVKFDPEEIQSVLQNLRAAQFNNNQMPSVTPSRDMYKSASGEPLGTHQGIVDGLEEAMVDAEIAKELGKPGMTEEKIAELISGEAEMLREAHVMGLSRVLRSHMHRPDDTSSVDFKKIKPIISTLTDSEVLKALNDEVLEEMMKEQEKKKKEEKKWTKFLQKPQRPVPRAKFGHHAYVDPEVPVKDPYKVKIVKQPKPKVAPDYRPKDFNTGLLPWEERALHEPSPPPAEVEDPILVPEEAPELLEAVDPLPESEVPDLEDSGIPLPPPKPKEEPAPEEDGEDEEAEEDIEVIEEEETEVVEEKSEKMEKNLADQLLAGAQTLVDPNAPLEDQLSQLRAQLAALAQLPGVIQQSLELVTRQLGHLTQLEAQTKATEVSEVREETQETENQMTAATEEIQQNGTEDFVEQTEEVAEEVSEPKPTTITAEELERMKREEEEMLEEQRKIEKQKKELMDQMRLEQEARQLKQRPTPRVGKPKPVFGPVNPEDRPVVLPGGRKWRNAKDVYDEEMFKETLQAQMEVINGKTMGINFMKYEKPPVSLEHLKESETYKMIHNMEHVPHRRVEMLTPVVAEADYRDKCRSITPCNVRMAKEEHLDIPQQVQP